MKVSRRKFIQKAAVATAAAFTLPRISIGRPGISPNSKINVASIGCQGRAAADLWEVAQQPHSHIVGLCDVDAEKLANPCLLAPNPNDTTLLNGRPKLEAPDARRYADFREMLHDLGDKVDAVIIGTPDHTHYPAAMLSMSLGKHVYCEKPMTNEIWGIRQMRNLANTSGVVTQMGIQSHTHDGLRIAKEWYEAGAIGEAKEIHMWTDRPLWPGGRTSYPPAMPVRAGFNWDLWLSYQKDRPYSEGYEPFVFRTWWDFGAGALGDIACHSMDIPNYIFGLSTPSKVEVIQSEKCTDISPPTASTLRYHFSSGKNHGPLTLTWYDGHFLTEEGRASPNSKYVELWSKSAGNLRIQNKPRPPAGWPADVPLVDNGQFIVGEKGYMYNPSMHVTTPRIFPHARWDDFKRNLPPKTLPRNKGGHWNEWLEAIMEGDPAMAKANFQYSAPLTETAMLGKLALRSGDSIVWDSKNLRVTNNEAANQFVKPTLRDGWSFGV